MSSAESVRGDRRRRPRWLTAVLYVVVLAILAFDVWATSFWARVGGPLGTRLAVGGMVVSLVLVALLVVDARRQWSSAALVDDRSADDRPVQ
jgi:uncharacterized membrane protein (DUF485 family)